MAFTTSEPKNSESLLQVEVNQLYNSNDTINERFKPGAPKLDGELEAIWNLNRDLVKFGGLV